MNIDLSRLGAFGQINNAGSRDVVQLAMQGETQLTKAGTYSAGRLLGRALRSVENEMRNDATRESFLQALGSTLKIEAARRPDGKFAISEDFLNRIARALGAKDGKKLLGMSDFEIKDGHVVGGHPLTERRITAIVDRIYENAGLSERRRATARAQEAKIATIGAKFETDLQETVRVMEATGWSAADDRMQRKVLADELGRATGMNEKQRQRLTPEDGENELSRAFDRLCSRFSGGQGRTAFDENGFYQDVSLLNAAIRRSTDRSPNLKTLDPIGFMKQLAGVDPEVLFPRGNRRSPDATYDPPGLPRATNPNQRADLYVQNARTWMKASSAYVGKEKSVDEMGLADLLTGPLARHEATALFTALEEVLRPLGLSVAHVVVPTGTKIPDFLRDVGGERGLVRLLRSLCETDEGNVLGYGEMRGLLAQATSRMIQRDADVLTQDAGAGLKMQNQVALAGGGLKGGKLSCSFKCGNATYESNFEPAHKADFEPEPESLSAEEKGRLDTILRNVTDPNQAEMLRKNLLDAKPRKLPLANLAHSSVTKDGRQLVSFTRFGQVAFVTKLHQSAGKDAEGVATALRNQYDELVSQMVATNPGLQDRILKGETQIPIYRIDMTSIGESYMNESADSLDGADRPVLDPNYDVSVRVGDESRTVKPVFQHLRIPMDARITDGERQFRKVMDGNLPILLGILEKAEARAKDLPPASYEARAIGRLTANLRSYCDRYASARDKFGGGMTFRDFCGEAPEGGDAFGVQMMRLGSQTGVLLSLIGDAPAINCNWGRDRTSAMDAMIKQVAVQLDAGQDLPDVFRSPVDDATKKFNTQMLFDTGNTDVARMTNTLSHNIALNQSEFGTGPRNQSQSGMIGLYDLSATGELKSYERTSNAAKDARNQRLMKDFSKAFANALKGSAMPPDKKQSIRDNLCKGGDKVDANKLADLLKGNKTFQKCLNPAPLSDDQVQEFTKRIRYMTQQTFKRALASNEPYGLAPECLRVGDADDAFQRLTINGDHVATNRQETPSIFDGKTFRGFSPHVRKAGDGKTNVKNPNEPIFARLAQLVPQTDPNRDAITRLFTSQLGLEGLTGDLSAESMRVDGEKGQDWGFGDMVSFMMNADFTATSFSSHPKDAGSYDVSLKNNEIVLTMRSPFGPQVSSLNGYNLSTVGDDANCVSVPVYDVTKTIRIPLGQPKLAEGQMPEYACDVSIRPYDWES